MSRRVISRRSLSKTSSVVQQLPIYQDNIIETLEQRETVQWALTSLSPRKAEIVRLFFGVDEDRPFTLDEIGRRFGLTRERVRQIKNEAIRTLHQKLHREQLDHFRPLHH